MDNNEKVIYAAAQPSQMLVGLFEAVEKRDATGLGRAGVFERAERYIVENHEKLDFKKIAAKKVLDVIEFEGELPSSFKVRINDTELDKKVCDILKKAYGVKKIQTPFRFRICMLAYLDFLNSCEECKNSEIEEIGEKIKYSETAKQTMLQVYKMLKTYVYGEDADDEECFLELLSEINILKLAMPDELCEKLDIILEQMRSVADGSAFEKDDRGAVGLEDFCRKCDEISKEIDKVFISYKKAILEA